MDNHTGHGDGPSLAPRWPTIGLYEGLHALTRGFGCWRATFGHNGARPAMGEDSDLLVLTKQIQIMANRRRGISVDIHAGTVMVLGAGADTALGCWCGQLARAVSWATAVREQR